MGRPKEANMTTIVEKLKTLLEITRPENCAMIVSAVLISLLAGLGHLPSLGLVIKVAVVAVAISAGGNALNDYYDAEIDAVNRPDRALPSGKITPIGLWTYALLLFFVGCVVAVLSLPTVPMVIALVNSALLVLYAYLLKKSGFAGNVIVSYLVASVFIFGSTVVGEWRIGIILGIVAFFINAAREVLKDLEDVLGDAQDGAETLPLVSGGRKAMIIVAAFLLIAIVVSPLPFFLGILTWPYLAIVVIADFLLIRVMYTVLANPTVGVAAHNQRIVKIAAVLGLVAFLAGAVPW